jgi:hypothetical protein
MKFREVAAFGKRQEFAAISKLLQLGFDVYLPLVDDQQIDCIIRRSNGDYLDVQIKARSEKCSPLDAGRFSAMVIPNPRTNYYFIFYSERINQYWIIPSLKLIELASRNKAGKNAGKYHVNLMGWSKKNGEVYPDPKFDDYRNKFDLLKPTPPST